MSTHRWQAELSSALSKTIVAPDFEKDGIHVLAGTLI